MYSHPERSSHREAEAAESKDPADVGTAGNVERHSHQTRKVEIPESLLMERARPGSFDCVAAATRQQLRSG
jgi:hypothetical protein